MPINFQLLVQLINLADRGVFLLNLLIYQIINAIALRAK